MSWRILITDGLAMEGIVLLRAEGEVIEADDLQLLPTIDAMIVRSRTSVTASVLGAGSPRLKVVGRAGVGVDNIDLPAARDLGVIVVNAPQAATIAAAEHTLALMLALTRNITRADASLRRGEWRKSELMGMELHGKTIGVIGMGRIGSALAKRAAALEMRVLGYDPNIPDDEIERHNAEPTSLELLLAQSDFISLHVPLTGETRGLINAEALSVAKAGARLICTARGGVVDESALLDALQDHRLAGAALDVFENEPPGLTPLVEHPNVICTPHIGAQTIEAQKRAGIDIAVEVLAALHGKPLRWRVA